MTMTKTLDVNKTSRNNLHFEPTTSGWYKDFHGAFLFKKVSGDFPATARLKVSGKTGELPTALWSLVVLMVREARPQINKDSWQSRGENWLFLRRESPNQPNNLFLEPSQPPTAARI